MMTEQQKIIPDQASWHALNAEIMSAHLRRLRLLLERRALWLRNRWTNSPASGGQVEAQVIRDAAIDQALEGEDVEAIELFFEQDPRARAVSEEIARIEEMTALESSAMAAEGKPAALDVVVHLFHLNRFERDTLLLAVGVEQEPQFGRLYGYAQDDAGLCYPTMQLALQLLSSTVAEQYEARRCFAPEAPLRRYRLVHFGAAAAHVPLAAAPLVTDHRMQDFLNGFNRLDEEAGGILRVIPDLPLAPVHEELLGSIAAYLENAGLKWRRQPVNLFGSKGSGRVAIARTLAARLGLHLYRLDPKRLPAPGPERNDLVRLLAREAILSQLALYFEVDEGEANEAASFLVERLPVFFVTASRSRLQADREMLAVEMPVLDSENRDALWRRAVEGAGTLISGAVEAIVEQFDFGPEMAARAVVAAELKARLRERGEPGHMTVDDLWQSCREQTAAQLDQLAQSIRPVYGWSDVVLPEEVMAQLREIAAQVTERARVYREWGFGRKLARGRGISALFSGVSGTGKTMSAEVLASHLKLDLYRVDLAGIVSKYIGETEKNLSRIFNAAENSGAILFFDEADALFGRRTEVKDSHDRFANIEINYLLQRMEDYRGLSILATNRKTEIDRAFLRRIRFLVDFPFPEASQRLRIWRKVFPPEAPTSVLDFDLLSLMEIPGGNIRNIALNAAFLAASKPEPVDIEHILQAARREYVKIDKLLADTEFHREYLRRRKSG